jgi:replicative DNA helicase
MSSRESEEVVLAGLLQDNLRVEQLTALVSPSDFGNPTIAALWEKAVEVIHDTGAVDVWTLADGDEDILAFLINLVKLSVTVNSEHHARRVREHGVKRKIVEKGQDLIELASDRESSAEDCIARVSEHATSLIQDSGGTGAARIEAAMPSVVEDLEARMNGEVLNVKTFYKNIDAVQGGMEGGDLVLLAGRPGMGKTTLAMNIAIKRAAKGGCPLVYSLEMPTKQLVYRLAGGLAGIDVSKFRGGSFTDEEWGRLIPALKRIEEMPIIIDDNPRMTVGDMRTRTRRACHDHPIDLVIIDYLGLIKSKQEKRLDAVTEISAGLKEIAREFNVPVMALSQLNRGVEMREDKRPLLSDLRDSGSLEQDADSVLMVYRDIVYNEESPYGEAAEVNIVKNRHGPLGKCWFQFDGEANRFIELTHAPEVREPEQQRSSFRERYS